MTDYPERVAIRNTVGVHAARTIPHGDARETACGLGIDRRAMNCQPDTEVTCWGCTKELRRQEAA